MNRRQIAILAFGCLLAAAPLAQVRSAGTPRPRSTPLHIEGVVRSDSGAPLSGTPTVRLYKRSELVAQTVAGSDGRFRFHEVVPGRYRLTAQLDGYQPVEDSVDAVERGTGFQRVEIRMRPVGEPKPLPGSPTVTVAELKIPRKAWDEYTRAGSDLQAGKYAKATERFRKAIGHHPPFVKAWQGLGVACRCLGDAAGAERAFRECLRLDSRNLLARLNLAEVCAATGRKEEARGILEETVLLYPEEGEPRVNLGRLDYLAGRLDEAEAQWRRAISLDHTKPDVHLLLAKLYQQKRQFQRMAAELAAYLEKAPEGPQAEQARTALEQLNRN